MTEGSQNQSFVWGNELLMAEGDKPFGNKGLLGQNEIAYDGFAYIPEDFANAYKYYDNLAENQNMNPEELSKKNPFVNHGDVTNLDYNLTTKNCSQITMLPPTPSYPNPISIGELFALDENIFRTKAVWNIFVNKNIPPANTIKPTKVGVPPKRLITNGPIIINNIAITNQNICILRP